MLVAYFTVNLGHGLFYGAFEFTKLTDMLEFFRMLYGMTFIGQVNYEFDLVAPV